MSFLRNRLFDTWPVLVHAHGSHAHKPQWPPIREALFEASPPRYGRPPELTLVTCNNGHPSMGLFEESLRRVGLQCRVLGHGIDPWVNSQHKPRLLLEAARTVDTELMLYADSRDAVLIDDPQRAVDLFRSLDCELLMGADMMSWPALPAFRKFEKAVPEAAGTDFRYLNGGTWIGRAAFVQEFFEAALQTAPVPEASDSEQGILRQLFPRFYPRVRLDYRCQIFQNVGFVTRDIFELTCGRAG